MFDCKPLGWLWAKFDGRYSEKNTIMFDDLRRNFVMNPGCGLKIRPFRKAHMNRDSDRELFELTKYLLEIAKVEVTPWCLLPLSSPPYFYIPKNTTNNTSTPCCEFVQDFTTLRHSKWEAYMSQRK